MSEYKIVLNEDGAIILDQEGQRLDTSAALSLIDTLRDQYERPACVYLLHNKNEGIYKIGMTAQEVSSRIAQVRYAENSRDIHLVHTIACETTTQAIDLEYIMHSVFANNRVRGEWFRIADVDIARVKEISNYIESIAFVLIHFDQFPQLEDETITLPTRERAIGRRYAAHLRPIFDAWEAKAQGL